MCSQIHPAQRHKHSHQEGNSEQNIVWPSAKIFNNEEVVECGGEPAVATGIPIISWAIPLQTLYLVASPIRSGLGVPKFGCTQYENIEEEELDHDEHAEFIIDSDEEDDDEQSDEEWIHEEADPVEELDGEWCCLLLPTIDEVTACLVHIITHVVVEEIRETKEP